MERKLAAIFSADVQAYSRLMGEDEEATVRTLTAYREVMASLIRQHRGRVVDSPGTTSWPSLPVWWTLWHVPSPSSGSSTPGTGRYLTPARCGSLAWARQGSRNCSPFA